MEKRDIIRVHELLSQYLSKIEVHLEFTPEELEHFILPRENVIDTYVVENE